MFEMFPEYKGMSYRDASKEAQRLIKQGWFLNFDRLKMLHYVMEREYEMMMENH